MSWLRRAALSLLALSVVAVGFVMPAQTANAAGPVTQVIVWGDSMSLAWGAYLEPLLGVLVIRNGTGSQDVQQTEERFNNWLTDPANADKLATTGHICWCGGVNANIYHQNTDKDLSSVVPALQRMGSKVPGLFMPISLPNMPEAASGTEGYIIAINDMVEATRTAVNERMKVAFPTAYAEVRGYLVSDGLQVAGLPKTTADSANIAQDVVPVSLRRDADDPHLNDAGKRVTASFLSGRARGLGWVPPETRAATTTDVVSSANPSADQERIQLTATVRNAGAGPQPTGTVQFFVDGGVFGSKATLNTSGVAVSPFIRTLALGSHDISAVYSGSPSFASSLDTLIQVVGDGSTQKLATSTTITSSQNPVPTGTKVRFSATVADASGQGGTVKPTGTVQFYLDGDASGPSFDLNTSGEAVTPLVLLPTGTHTITAVYSGNTKYNGSTGGPYSQVVGTGGGGGGEQASTSTVIDSSMNPAPRTTRIHFSATVTNTSGQPGLPTPTGTVQFYLDGDAYGPSFDLNTLGVAATPSVRLPPGASMITAVYSGDANYLPSTSPVYTQTMT